MVQRLLNTQSSNVYFALYLTIICVQTLYFIVVLASLLYITEFDLSMPQNLFFNYNSILHRPDTLKAYFPERIHCAIFYLDFYNDTSIYSWECNALTNYRNISAIVFLVYSMLALVPALMWNVFLWIPFRLFAYKMYFRENDQLSISKLQILIHIHDNVDEESRKIIFDSLKERSLLKW